MLEKAAVFSAEKICTAQYRPFFRQHLYYDKLMNEM